MGYQFKLKSMAKSGKFDPEKFQTYIENCEAMTGRISRIVRSLRDFARDADTDSIASIGVLKIIEDVYVLTQHRLSENGIQFRVVKPQDDFNLECRFAQVEQVIVSIINNAHEAIAPITGEKWIEFQASQSNDKCVFMVTDCGGGIPADVVDKIFSPFFTTKKASNASGLGLSTSYGIIQNHGGQIFVDRKCANTRFVIELPLAAPKTADPPASVQTPAA